MTSQTLFLYTGGFCFLIYSCVGDLPLKDTSKQCEYDNIKKCNDQFKQVLVAAKAKQRWCKKINIYCAALQAFMNCLDGSLESCVGGSWLQNYSSVILGHGMMDKKCRMCPNHDYRDLQRALQARNKIQYIDSKSCPSCAKFIHMDCVLRFLRKVETDTNICHDVQEFINCYREAKDTKCGHKAEIVKDFSNLCSQLGERMLEEDKKYPGLMC